MKLIRCAIYTRKSSEEGLSQDFNSLDAQREACAAYILSQACEGWMEVKERYDDGGLSGGTLDRPALQRLLADVSAGRIDIIVVYKVDRLTRSLLDFARLVEAFDGTGTSFVSITQSFNTTTSMGRLTLNMLLSFAQFEREVTAERIRDKIAASKAKGMWMGGVPPLGYRPDGRSLAVIDEQAEIVRTIYRRYVEIGNVRLLEHALAEEGLFSPRRMTISGKSMGGRVFTRGQLYQMLKNRTYRGEVQHKDQIYPGLHPPIIDPSLWDAVQQRLKDNLQGARDGTRTRATSLLAGRLVDAGGGAMSAAHATKNKARYRYYVSHALHHGTGEGGMRIPAREIEGAVAERVAAAFDDPLALMAEAKLDFDPHHLHLLHARAAEAAAKLRRRDRTMARQIVTRVQVERDRIMIGCDLSRIAAQLGVDPPEQPDAFRLTAMVRLTRLGRAVRLVQDNGQLAASRPDPSLIRLVTQAHRWWAELRKGEVNITALCEREKVSDAWMSRVLRLAFLSPAATRAILQGAQPTKVAARCLLATGAVQACWKEQGRHWLG